MVESLAFDLTAVSTITLGTGILFARPHILLCAGCEPALHTGTVMRTLILSDLHLGTHASKAAAMLDDIRSLARQYDRVILNGDTLDRYETPGCTPDAGQWLRDATEACSSRDGDPVILSGNHDPAISGQQWVYIEETETLVFHGDCVEDCTHPTRKVDRILAARLGKHWKQRGGRPENFLELVDFHRRVQAEHQIEHPSVREPRSTLSYLASVVFPPTKPYHIIRYWQRAPKIAAALGTTFHKPVRNVVFGHTHRAGRWSYNGITVYNTGSFMPMSAPFAISTEHGQLSFQPLQNMLRQRIFSHGTFQHSPTPDAGKVQA
jgi:UDP-2,3-diacylglucosamine pyrophosphatase LpxH